MSPVLHYPWARYKLPVPASRGRARDYGAGRACACGHALSRYNAGLLCGPCMQKARCGASASAGGMVATNAAPAPSSSAGLPPGNAPASSSGSDLADASGGGSLSPLGPPPFAGVRDTGND